MRQPTNVLSRRPDYLLGWLNGKDVLVPIEEPTTIDITSSRYAADRTGRNACDGAFKRAIADARQSRSNVAGLADPTAQTVIEVPAGVYLLKELESMIGSETQNGKISGLRIKGASRGSTIVLFKPTVGGALCNAKQWLDIEFADITFVAQTSGCTFFTTPGTQNEQQWAWRKCNFVGWKHILVPLGNNNCSEVIFSDCGNYGMQNDGAWLHIPAAGTSDQFLNYWWTDCKHWSTSAPIIDAAKGGHFHIKNMDASDWGAAAVASPATPDAGTFLIKLRGISHDGLGVLHMTAHVLRGELKNANAKLLYTEWGDYGQITLDGVDITSQVPAYTYGPQMVYVKVPDADGAKVTIRDSQMAGGITVNYPDSAWSRRGRVEVMGGSWWQKTSPSDVVTYAAQGGNVNPPLVIFENVRPASNPAYTVTGNAAERTAAAYVVWDAAIGSVGIPGVCYPAANSETRKRSVRVSAVYGGLKSGESSYTRFPLGSIITDIRISAPPGAVAEVAASADQTDGGEWLIQADKAGAPVNVTTLITAAGTLANGFNVGGELAVPFKCTTAARCVVAATASKVAGSNEITIEYCGYW